MVAEYLQHIRQQSDAGAEQHQSDNVERFGALFAIVGQMQIDQNKTGDSDRQIHEI